MPVALDVVWRDAGAFARARGDASGGLARIASARATVATRVQAARHRGAPEEAALVANRSEPSAPTGPRSADRTADRPPTVGPRGSAPARGCRSAHAGCPQSAGSRAA